MPQQEASLHCSCDRTKLTDPKWAREAFPVLERCRMSAGESPHCLTQGSSMCVCACMCAHVQVRGPWAEGALQPCVASSPGAEHGACSPARTARSCAHMCTCTGARPLGRGCSPAVCGLQPWGRARCMLTCWESRELCTEKEARCALGRGHRLQAQCPSPELPHPSVPQTEGRLLPLGGEARPQV